MLSKIKQAQKVKYHLFSHSFMELISKIMTMMVMIWPECKKGTVWEKIQLERGGGKERILKDKKYLSVLHIYGCRPLMKPTKHCLKKWEMRRTNGNIKEGWLCSKYIACMNRLLTMKSSCIINIY
jgi:hypothetical protein